MVAKTIELDEDASKILDSMATAYDGNVSFAISELLRSREIVESFLDQLETGQRTALAAQKERAERSFREGRSISWPEVKRKNGLSFRRGPPAPSPHLLTSQPRMYPVRQRGIMNTDTS